jgi:hypothetical protein
MDMPTSSQQHPGPFLPSDAALRFSVALQVRRPGQLYSTFCCFFYYLLRNGAEIGLQRAEFRSRATIVIPRIQLNVRSKSRGGRPGVAHLSRAAWSKSCLSTSLSPSHSRAAHGTPFLLSLVAFVRGIHTQVWGYASKPQLVHPRRRA